jgi:hypothetical protein
MRVKSRAILYIDGLRVNSRTRLIATILYYRLTNLIGADLLFALRLKPSEKPRPCAAIFVRRRWNLANGCRDDCDYPDTGRSRVNSDKMPP